MRKSYPCSWSVFATGVWNNTPAVWEVLLNRRTRQWYVRVSQTLPWGVLKGKRVPVSPEVGRMCHAAGVNPESGVVTHPAVLGGKPPVVCEEPEPAYDIDPQWCDGRVWTFEAQPGLRQAIMAYCRENHIRATFPDSGMAGVNGVTTFQFQAVR